MTEGRREAPRFHGRGCLVFLQHISVRINNFLFTRDSSVSVHWGRSFYRTWGRQMLPEVDVAVQVKGNYCQVLFFCHNLGICSWTESDWMIHYSDLAQFFTSSFSGRYWTFFRVGNQFNIKPVILIYQHLPWKIYQEMNFCSNRAFNVKYLSQLLIHYKTVLEGEFLNSSDVFILIFLFILAYDITRLKILFISLAAREIPIG